MSRDVSQTLAELRAQAQARVVDLEAEIAGVVAASVDSNADDEHDPEGSTIAYEREQLAALLRAARERVTDLDATLARATAGGSYGRCAVCGNPIPAERLAARPTATTCVACAPRRPAEH